MRVRVLVCNAVVPCLWQCEKCKNLLELSVEGYKFLGVFALVIDIHTWCYLDGLMYPDRKCSYLERDGRYDCILRLHSCVSVFV